MNKGSIVERLCSDLIAKSRDINGLLYFTLPWALGGETDSRNAANDWVDGEI